VADVTLAPYGPNRSAVQPGAIGVAMQTYIENLRSTDAALPGREDLAAALTELLQEHRTLRAENDDLRERLERVEAALVAFRGAAQVIEPRP
jgi:regulator of replication initiation timing